MGIGEALAWIVVCTCVLLLALGCLYRRDREDEEAHNGDFFVHWTYTEQGPFTSESNPRGPSDFDDCTCEYCLNEREASPCDTGECNCYMGPIYSVWVGDIECEETRSTDPAVALGLFLPVLGRNPGFADRGVALREVVE